METRVSIDVILSRCRSHRVIIPAYIGIVTERFMEQTLYSLFSVSCFDDDPELKYDMLDTLSMGRYRKEEKYMSVAARLENLTKVSGKFGAKTLEDDDILLDLTVIGVFFKRKTSGFNKDVRYFMNLRVSEFAEYLETLPGWKASWYIGSLKELVEIHNDALGENYTIADFLDRAFGSIKDYDYIILPDDIDKLKELAPDGEDFNEGYRNICRLAVLVWILMVTGPLAICSKDNV